MTRLPFADAVFDAVVDVVSSAHNSDQDAIMAEVARVLKPGGKLFLMTPTDQCSVQPFVGYGAIRFATYQDVCKMLADHFIDVQILTTRTEQTYDTVIEHWVATGRKA